MRLVKTTLYSWAFMVLCIFFNFSPANNPLVLFLFHLPERENLIGQLQQYNVYFIKSCSRSRDFTYIWILTNYRLVSLQPHAFLWVESYETRKQGNMIKKMAAFLSNIKFHGKLCNCMTGLFSSKIRIKYINNGVSVV